MPRSATRWGGSMVSLPVRWILARVYIQGTEDEERVAHALDTAVPGGATSRIQMEGQFGNPVLVLTRRLDAAEDVRAAWARWLDANLLRALPGELPARLDQDGVLHFRIDKQSAFGGALVPAAGTDSIDIQVKLKAYPAKREEILRVARSLIAGAV